MCRWGVQDFRGCVQDLAGPPLSRTPPPPDRPKFRSFFPSPATNFALSSLFFGGFGATKPSHDNPRTPNVHISGPWRFKHHQNSTKGPQKERRKKETCGGRGKKKREILGPPPFGAPPFGAPPFGAPAFGAPPFWAPPFWAPPFWPPLFPFLGPHPERPPPFGASQFGAPPSADALA